MSSIPSHILSPLPLVISPSYVAQDMKFLYELRAFADISFYQILNVK